MTVAVIADFILCQWVEANRRLGGGAWRASMAHPSKGMIQLRRVRELGKRLALVSTLSAVAWFLHSEALRGLFQLIGRILAKAR
jgi:hypothetical protein